MDIGGPGPAFLPVLAFEGVARRNRPNLQVFNACVLRVHAWADEGGSNVSHALLGLGLNGQAYACEVQHSLLTHASLSTAGRRRSVLPCGGGGSRPRPSADVHGYCRQGACKSLFKDGRCEGLRKAIGRGLDALAAVHNICCEGMLVC